MSETITVTWSLNADTVRRVRAAAALTDRGVQEFASECLSACAAAVLRPITDPPANDPG